MRAGVDIRSEAVGAVAVANAALEDRVEDDGVLTRDFREDFVFASRTAEMLRALHLRTVLATRHRSRDVKSHFNSALLNWRDLRKAVGR